MNLTKRGCLLCGSQCGVEGCKVCELKAEPCVQCAAKYNSDELARRWSQANLALRQARVSKA